MLMTNRTAQKKPSKVKLGLMDPEAMPRSDQQVGLHDQKKQFACEGDLEEKHTLFENCVLQRPELKKKKLKKIP